MMGKKSVGVRLWALFFSLLILLTACEDAAMPGSETAGATGANPSGATGAAVLPADTGAYTTAYEFAPEDTDAAWNAGDATAILLGGDSAQITGGGAAFSGKTLSINRAGTYVLSGTLNDGQVLIEAGSADVVRLVLNGVSLHNESGPAIYAPQSKKVVLILAPGTENTVSDGSGYAAAEDSDAPVAAIYMQDDLSITGEGTLRVTGAAKHGIRAQDVLAITGGVIHVDAEGDALRGRDGVAVQGGILTLNAEGDGIQSNNDVDEAKGFVVITGGVFAIASGEDGIQAQTALTVKGGDLEIITGGGSAAAPQQTESVPGGWGGNRPGEQSAEPAAETADSVSKKALKAGKQLVITGGAFVIDAEDDAVHANGTVFVAGGTFFIQTGDDGFHADAALEISGGELDIAACYEGIEGLSVTVSGGVISVVASDDAVNAAGGVDSASPTGGPMGRDSFAANGDVFIRITGGTLDLYALYDGIDSNGDIFFEGGLVKISGPSQGMDGAIDLDGSMTVTGGAFITAGSVLSASQDSTQPVILVSYTEQLAAGSLIEVKDAQGETLLSYESKIACSMSGFTSPAFQIGATYSLFINGEKRTDITPSSILTGIADDGGAYSGGMGGGMGRGGGRRNWDGSTPPEGATPPEGGTLPGGGVPPAR